MNDLLLSPIRLNELELLIQNSVEKAIRSQCLSGPTEQDCWYNLSELCDYLPDKPAKATIYGWVNAGTIPVHKGGKKLRFLKSEIDSWLKQGRKKTLAETVSEAETYIKRKGGKHV